MEILNQSREVQTEDANTQNVIPIAIPSGLNRSNSYMNIDNVYSARETLTSRSLTDKCRFFILHFYY